MNEQDKLVGRAQVCPDCGSEAVRWRKRRIYDVVFTYLRYFADTIAGTVFGSTGASVPGSGYSERTNEGRVAAAKYREERKLYEDRVGSMTASRFWKCRQCGHDGQVFGDIDNVLQTRARLESLEGTVSRNLGSVNRPIGGDEPPKD